MNGKETMEPGARVVLHGQVADIRGDFALITVDGSPADSSYLSVDCGSFELQDRAILHGEVSAFRGGFAVVVVDGCIPPGTLISVDLAALLPEEAADPAEGV